MQDKNWSLEMQMERVSTWKWRIARLGETVSSTARKTKTHQGVLCDWANQVRHPIDRNFWKIENWITKQEKKKKFV